jgi:hypothetical protein
MHSHLIIQYNTYIYILSCGCNFIVHIAFENLDPLRDELSQLF